MSLTIGEISPDFCLKATSDATICKKDLLGKPYILYFYPKDFTPGCTAEACSFRDHFSSFRDIGCDVYGVSTDSMASHTKFKAQYNLPFELLSDRDGSVSKAYGATVPILGMGKRITYLIDAEGKVKARYSNMINARGHIKSMLQELNVNERKNR